jgi:hypothetical protein
MDSEKSYAESVVIRGKRIIDIGDAGIVKQYSGAEIVDLKSRVLLPGFIDSHNHLSSFSCFFPTWANLFGLQSHEDVLKAMRDHARKNQENGWLVGFGWLDFRSGGVDLTQADLDELGFDRPVLIIQATFHMSVTNSIGLKITGITRETPDPECGSIIRDSDGEPTGVLIENAQACVFEKIMNPGIRKHADLIRARAEELLSFGITAIHDPGVTPAAEKAYHFLHDEGRLPVSVLMMPHGATILDNHPGKWLEGLRTGNGDEYLRIGPVKIFADGATPQTVAYNMIIMGRSMTSGSYRADFRDILIDATLRGFRVCVHSFGNVTTDAVLDAFEKAREIIPDRFEMRPRLEHVTLISQSQIQRLAAMGGCVSVQPQFLLRAGNFSKAKVENATWLAYGDLFHGGVCVAASSDDPGGFMDARDPIKGAVMGSTMSNGDGNTVFPDQVLPFERWLWFYTAGSAYAGGQENERGMLKKGLVADLVILDGILDPMNPPVVDETWKDGKLVYHRQNPEEII